MRSNLFIGLMFSFVIFAPCRANNGANTVDNTAPFSKLVKGYIKEEMYNAKDSQSFEFLSIPDLYVKGWDTLSQPKFWSTVMQLPEDSGVLNIGKNRKILNTYKVDNWENLSQDIRTSIRDSIRNSYCLDSAAHIYFTTGKKQFYHFGNVLPHIGRAIELFNQQGVDPFYAQAILLIESPAAVSRSNVGAYGHFQLMRKVAIKMGLEVNRHHDDRKNFDKSAVAAAKLLKTICIPRLDSILDTLKIAYHPTDIWYRLLVLHVYHAGAYNVSCALNALKPDKGGMNIITGLWHTEAAGFRNASQDYSQVAIASLVSFDKYIRQHCYKTCICRN